MAKKKENYRVSKEEVNVEEEDTSSSSEAGNLPVGANTHVFSRSEAKARKHILKHGLKKVEGVVRVTFSRPKNVLFVIVNPDVYKMPYSDTYIVFGQIKIQDTSSQEHMNAVQQLARNSVQNAKVSASLDGSKEASVLEEAQVDLDETGLLSKDIELVMDQTKVSRARAVRALRDNDGDIVNAIMSIAI
ncbi:hypothetical protein PORY_000163 [Pneumocystis oryctolagi]|uniref:Uncharacterized protein n=1 Tax=Pneumocystis oryctolagi TaxID=42067 RepID=A0ACB7CGC0_9ASCO|nr:hypothetical protein PORY_000163 [Pneumocystis oryctolagi]